MINKLIKKYKEKLERDRWENSGNIGKALVLNEILEDLRKIERMIKNEENENIFQERSERFKSCYQ